jgi:hypothetical protein
MALRFGTSSKKTKSPVADLNPGPSYDYHMIWTEKYEPKISKDLVLHHTKIKAARDWLLKSCQADNSGFIIESQSIPLLKWL